MTINKTLKIESNGRTIEIEIERTKEVQDDIAYADGWNINLGKKTVDSIYIQVYVDGVCKTETSSTPQIITDKNLIAKGAYAKIGNAYLTEINYNKIMALIAEIEAELEITEEYKEVESKEIAEEARKEAAYKANQKHYQKLLDSGMCPKCETWCYGDCGA